MDEGGPGMSRLAIVSSAAIGANASSALLALMLGRACAAMGRSVDVVTRSSDPDRPTTACDGPLTCYGVAPRRGGSDAILACELARSVVELDPSCVVAIDSPGVLAVLAGFRGFGVGESPLVELVAGVEEAGESADGSAVWTAGGWVPDTEIEWAPEGNRSCVVVPVAGSLVTESFVLDAAQRASTLGRGWAIATRESAGRWSVTRDAGARVAEASAPISVVTEPGVCIAGLAAMRSGAWCVVPDDSPLVSAVEPSCVYTPGDVGSLSRALLSCMTCEAAPATPKWHGLTDPRVVVDRLDRIANAARPRELGRARGVRAWSAMERLAAGGLDG